VKWRCSHPYGRPSWRNQLAPAVRRLGATVRIVDNPVPDAGPFLLAHRHEADGLPTVLLYGHGDVVPGQDGRWRTGLSPWELVVEGDRLYGRGTADNKGRHTVNLAALEQVLAARGGRLGFNPKVLVETGEESGSPGLHAVCRRLADDLAADLLVASDGPRLAAGRPTLFLGSRGAVDVRLRGALREGAHHSGNWGGALRNPATVLAGALATLVDSRGRILVEGLRPPALSEPVAAALTDLTVGGGGGDPEVDTD
ncbi:M20/M25/M40 family metallo-hydrolase, partial [Streptomyces swartbergensis]|uniref:M20/M25/M40 family metallo-hydrolase n=1 Tax=Streptomyces swartbergensis TaxID=487165 RepID=UPI001FC956D5